MLETLCRSSIISVLDKFKFLDFSSPANSMLFDHDPNRFLNVAAQYFPIQL